MHIHIEAGFLKNELGDLSANFTGNLGSTGVRNKQQIYWLILSEQRQETFDVGIKHHDDVRGQGILEVDVVFNLMGRDHDVAFCLTDAVKVSTKR